MALTGVATRSGNSVSPVDVQVLEPTLEGDRK